MNLYIKGVSILDIYDRVLKSLIATTETTGLVLEVNLDEVFESPIKLDRKARRVVINKEDFLGIINNKFSGYFNNVTDDLLNIEQEFWTAELFGNTSIEKFFVRFCKNPSSKKLVHSFWKPEYANLEVIPSTIYISGSTINGSSHDFFLNFHLRSSDYRGLMLLDLFLFREIGVHLEIESGLHFNTLTVFVDKLKI